MVNKKARMALKRVVTVNRKYSDKNVYDELLGIVPEEEGMKERKNRSVIFN